LKLTVVLVDVNVPALLQLPFKLSELVLELDKVPYVLIETPPVTTTVPVTPLDKSSFAELAGVEIVPPLKFNPLLPIVIPPPTATEVAEVNSLKVVELVLIMLNVPLIATALKASGVV